MSPRIRLIAGIALAVITAVLLAVYTMRLNAAQASEPFLRLAPGVTAAQNTNIPAAAIQTAYLPESAGALVSVAIKDTPENREWLKGRRVGKDIAPGSLLLYEYFNDQPANRFAAKIAPGKRAISIEANASSAVSFLLEPGSRVDIIGTLAVEQGMNMSRPPGGGGPQEFTSRKISTQTILQNVRVLAVGNLTSRGAYNESAENRYATVTVEVTPNEAEKLVFARANLRDGALTLILRNPADASTVELPSRDWAGAQNPN
jgi:Flp pilus assembly protein CpaB